MTRSSSAAARALARSPPTRKMSTAAASNAGRSTVLSVLLQRAADRRGGGRDVAAGQLEQREAGHRLATVAAGVAVLELRRRRTRRSADGARPPGSTPSPSAGCGGSVEARGTRRPRASWRRSSHPTPAAAAIGAPGTDRGTARDPAGRRTRRAAPPVHSDARVQVEQRMHSRIDRAVHDAGCDRSDLAGGHRHHDLVEPRGAAGRVAECDECLAVPQGRRRRAGRRRRTGDRRSVAATARSRAAAASPASSAPTTGGSGGSPPPRSRRRAVSTRVPARREPAAGLRHLAAQHQDQRRARTRSARRPRRRRPRARRDAPPPTPRRTRRRRRSSRRRSPCVRGRPRRAVPRRPPRSRRMPRSMRAERTRRAHLPPTNSQHPVWPRVSLRNRGGHSYVRREMSDLLECSLHRNVRVEARDMRSPAYQPVPAISTTQKPLHILRTAASSFASRS